MVVFWVKIQNMTKQNTISTFTTRVDSIFATTFLIMAPEHPKVLEITKPENLAEVKKYIKTTKNKSERQRQINKEKTGVFTGSFVLHPLTQAKIPVWIADFVLPNYGTGCVMANAHDERDVEFALKYKIPLKETLKPTKETVKNSKKSEVFSDDGILFDSEEFSGLESVDARSKIGDKLVALDKGKKQTNYRFRDWVFSRQRYWGEPFPIEYYPEK